MILLDRALSAIGLERRSSNNSPGGDSYWSDFALRGTAVSDFPICNNSFNLSYCGFDL